MPSPELKAFGNPGAVLSSVGGTCDTGNWVEAGLVSQGGGAAGGLPWEGNGSRQQIACVEKICKSHGSADLLASSDTSILTRS